MPAPPPSTPAPQQPPQTWIDTFKWLGPGLALAATGVGAGDMIAAAVAGSRFGVAILWATLLGALLKYVLNEGIARWQLGTGTTLVEGWMQHLGRWVRIYLLGYLLLWSFVVGGALIAACGLAAHAMLPQLSVEMWGLLHTSMAFGLVWVGNYRRFEDIMKVLIGLMFLALISCAAWLHSPWEVLWESVRQTTLPTGGLGLVMGVLGGVGGSVTLLSYGYWMRERGWTQRSWLGMVRMDLRFAYGITGLFGAAVVTLAAWTLYPKGAQVQGNQAVLAMAGMLGTQLGKAGLWIFLFGFWAAVTSSIVGVWQGIPYLFCDLVSLWKPRTNEQRQAILDTRSRWYRGYLLWQAFPPMLLMLWGKPVGLIILYAIIGALFMPFLAGTLLWMNNHPRWMPTEMRNGWKSNLMLGVCLLLFVWLGVQALWTRLFS